MPIDPVLAAALTDVMTEKSGHLGEAFTDDELAALKALIGRLAVPFVMDTREDRMLSVIAGYGGGIAVALVKENNRALMLQLVHGKPFNLFSLPTFDDMIYTLERSFEPPDDAVIH